MLTNARLSEFVDGVLAVVSMASLLGAVAAVAVIALVRLCRSLGLAAIGLLVAANGSTWVLKNVALSRPDLGLRELTPATLNSMPSGHSTAVFSAVVALLFVVPARWRGPVSTIGAGYACLTALATMSAGWHRAGDSLAAFLLVGVWAAAAGLVVVLLDGPAPDAAASSRPSRRRLLRWPVVTTTGSLAVGSVVVLGLYANERLRAGTIGAVSAFLAAGLLIAGTASGVLVAILSVLDRIEPDATVPDE